MTLPSVHTVTECPKCGETDGFFIRTRVSGVIQINYSFDGTSVDNSGMYDSMTHRDLKFAYCSVCRHKLGRWDEESKKVVSERQCELRPSEFCY